MPKLGRACVRRLQRHAASIAIALAAVAIAWIFVAVTLRHTRSFGLPIEDAYIYLTYAKQFGRGQPFTYFPGGGYSAGSTSVLWPMVLAPFWTLGARGHPLVWVSYGVCTTLYAATCVGCQLVARRMFGPITGLFAGGLALVIAPFAFTALAGMEVAFASSLLLWTVLLIGASSTEQRPRAVLVLCLTATALSRPEAMMIVGGLVCVAMIRRVKSRDLRAAGLWALPLAAPGVWLTANKLFAGHWFPNTGVAKSHFYLPGFDWTYWREAVAQQSGRMLKRLFWGDGTPSPFIWPRLIALFWVIGGLRVIAWVRREKQWLFGTLLLGSPFVLMFAVIASSGAWDFHNYRYIAPAFPLIMLTAACALAPISTDERTVVRKVLHRACIVGGIAVVGLFVAAARAPLASDMLLYAQDAADLDHQVVTIGHYIHDHLPESSIMFHDAGAIAYYGDRPVYDMLGLVTNFQAGVANNGPGSRFEFLESLPAERRPTHFAYYPSWMGQSEFYGEVLLRTPLAPPFASRRLIGGLDMQLITANWDHVHTAERPLDPHPGWHVVDRVDVADMASERQHAWTGALGRRNYADPTARWSFFHKQVAPVYALDGGRTIRGGTEQLTVRIDPTRPVRVILRTGGEVSYPFNEPIRRDVAIRLLSEAGAVVGEAMVPRPDGRLVELPFDVRASSATLTLRTEADGPYHSFHWFVLQPD